MKVMYMLIKNFRASDEMLTHVSFNIGFTIWKGTHESDINVKIIVRIAIGKLDMAGVSDENIIHGVQKRNICTCFNQRINVLLLGRLKSI